MMVRAGAMIAANATDTRRSRVFAMGLIALSFCWPVALVTLAERIMFQDAVAPGGFWLACQF